MTAPRVFLHSWFLSLSPSILWSTWCFIPGIFPKNAPRNNVDVCDNLLDNLYAFFPLSATILRFPICLQSRNSRLSQRCSMFHIPFQMAQSGGLSTPHWTWIPLLFLPLDFHWNWTQLLCGRSLDFPWTSVYILISLMLLCNWPARSMSDVLDWVYEKVARTWAFCLFLWSHGFREYSPHNNAISSLVFNGVQDLCVLSNFFFLFHFFPWQEGSHRVLLFFFLLWFARAFCFDKLRLVTYM